MIRILLVVFILILFYVPSYISEDFLSTVTEEDGFYEWLGALSFLVTSLAFIVLATRPSKLKVARLAFLCGIWRRNQLGPARVRI